MAIKQANKKEMEIPEGQEIKDVRVVCKKHGDITNSVLMISYTTEDNETGKKTDVQCGYCIPCLNEYLLSLEKEGKISSTSFVPIYGPKDEKKDEVKEEPKAEVHESPSEEEITTKD